MKKLLPILLLLIGVYCTFNTAYAQHEGLSYYVDGETLRRSGQYEKAIVEFNRAIQREPNNYKYLYARAQCEQKIKKIESAILSLNTAVKLKNDFVPAYLLMAQIFQSNNDLNKASEYYDLAFKYEEDIDKKINYKFFVMNKLLKEENLKEAYAKIKEAKDVAPTNETVLYFHAKISNAIGHYEEAKNSILEAESKIRGLKPDESAKYYYELGYAYYHLHEYSKANEAWVKAGDSEAYKGKVEKFSPKYFCALALTYYKFHDNSLSKSYVDKAIKVQEDFPIAHVLLAQLSKRRTDHGSTLSHYINAATHEANIQKKIIMYHKIADLQIDAGDYISCLNTVTMSLKLKSDDEDALFTKCLALYKMGNYKDCITDTENILKGNVEEGMRAQFNFLLGLAYKKLANKKSSKISFMAATGSSLKDAVELELAALDAN